MKDSETDTTRRYWDNDTGFTLARHQILDTLPSRLMDVEEAIKPYIGYMRDEKKKDYKFRILDLAAGPYVAYFPKDLTPNVSPLDISLIKLKTQDNPRSATLADIGKTLPFADGSFNWSTVFFASRYLEESQQENLAREMLRVSKSGVLVLDHEFPTHHKMEASPFCYEKTKKVFELEMGDVVTKRIWSGSGPDMPSPVWMVVGTGKKDKDVLPEFKNKDGR